MCGRLRVGKENLHVAGLVGAPMCSACLRGSHDHAKTPDFNNFTVKRQVERLPKIKHLAAVCKAKRRATAWVGGFVPSSGQPHPMAWALTKLMEAKHPFAVTAAPGLNGRLKAHEATEIHCNSRRRGYLLTIRSPSSDGMRTQ
jgi:hypothetical protein